MVHQCPAEVSEACGGSPSPSPGPSPGPSPTPGAHCDRCSDLVRSTCSEKGNCQRCAENHKTDWTPIGCMVEQCPAEVSHACDGAARDLLFIYS
jgi:hypothetical protein